MFLLLRFSAHAYFEKVIISFVLCIIANATELCSFSLCFVLFFGDVDYRLSVEIPLKQTITDLFEMLRHLFSWI